MRDIRGNFGGSCNSLNVSSCLNTTSSIVASSASGAAFSTKLQSAVSTASSTIMSTSTQLSTFTSTTSLFSVSSQNTATSTLLELTSSIAVSVTSVSPAATMFSAAVPVTTISSESVLLDTTTSGSLISPTSSLASASATSLSSFTGLTGSIVPGLTPTLSSSVDPTRFATSVLSTASATSETSLSTVSSFSTPSETVLSSSTVSELTSSMPQYSSTTTSFEYPPYTTALPLTTFAPNTASSTQTGAVARHESPRTVIIATASAFAAIAVIMLIFGIFFQRRRRRSKRQRATPSIISLGRASWPSQLFLHTTPSLHTYSPPETDTDGISDETLGDRYYRGVEIRRPLTKSPLSQPPMSNVSHISPLLRTIRSIKPRAEQSHHAKQAVIHTISIEPPSSDAVAAPSPVSAIPSSLRPGPVQSFPNSIDAIHSPLSRNHIRSQEDINPPHEPARFSRNLLFPYNNFENGQPTSNTIATTFLTVPSPLYTPYSLNSSRSADSWHSGRPRSNPFDLEEG